MFVCKLRGGVCDVAVEDSMPSQIAEHEEAKKTESASSTSDKVSGKYPIMEDGG